MPNLRRLVPAHAPRTLVTTIFALLALAGCQPKTETSGPVAVQVPVPVISRFGLSFSKHQLIDTVVPQNSSLGSLIAGLGLPGSISQKLADASVGIFDVRGLRAGRPLHLIQDGTGRVLHLVYEQDPIRWIRFDLDTLVPQVVRGTRKVDTVQRVVGGTIYGSLWENLVSQGHTPELVGRVADILAWQVDFFSVQPGDKYRVVYEAYLVDGQPVAMGRIQAVSFEQSGKTYKAFLFETPDGQSGYYDADGSPCKRQFLKAPLQYSRISSRFSAARMHPVLRIVRPHYGVDYAAPSGTPVMCVGNGTVVAEGWDPKGGGNFVKIRHTGGVATCYMHLKSIATAMRAGAHVSQGELLGWVGMTGLATGPHLDFRFYREGRPVNPLTAQSPPAPPLPAALRAVFLAQAARVGGTLDAVATDFHTTQSTTKG